LRYGYWYDLAKLRLDDSGNTATWVQAMPLGAYEHPVHGPIEITSDKVQQFAQNVKSNVRGQDLDIDYDHKANGGEAAGWVKDAEARNDGLWVLVDWTKDAYQKLKSKAYRYFSPEYADEWEHPKTGEKYKNVLFGGALTNRPFLKDILAINMAEIIGGITPPAPAPTPPAPSNPKPSEGGLSFMDPKQLRKLLGLAEDASDEDVTKKLTERLAQPAPPAPREEPPDTPASPEDVAALIRNLSDVEGNPALKALTDLVQAQQKQLNSMSYERHKETVERRLSDLDVELKEKGLAVPPAVKDQLREILNKSPKQLAEQVYNAYKQTIQMGLIDMTERGWQRRTGEKSPTEQYLTEVDQIMAKATAANRKMSYAEAAMMVARQNPQLTEQYRQESYIEEGGMR